MLLIVFSVLPLLEAKADSPSVYGKVRVSYNIFDTDNDPMGMRSERDNTFIASHSSRIGFKGTELLENNYLFKYQVEIGVKVNGDEDNDYFSLRNSFATIGHTDFGQISAGRLNTAYKSVTSKIDVFSGTVADYNQVVGAASSLKGSKFFNVRADQIILYNSPTWDGVNLSASYSGDQNINDGNSYENIYNASLGFKYTLKHWSFYLGHEVHNNSTIIGDAQSIKKYKDTAIKYAVLYKTPSFRSGFIFESTETDSVDKHKTRDIFLLNTAYTTNKTTYKAQYWEALKSAKSNLDYSAKGLSFGVSYKFNTEIEASLIYSHINNNKNGKYGFNAGTSPTVDIKGDDNNPRLSILSLGINYHFGY